MKKRKLQEQGKKNDVTKKMNVRIYFKFGSRELLIVSLYPLELKMISELIRCCNNGTSVTESLEKRRYEAHEARVLHLQHKSSTMRVVQYVYFVCRCFGSR